MAVRIFQLSQYIQLIIFRAVYGSLKFSNLWWKSVGKIADIFQCLLRQLWNENFAICVKNCKLGMLPKIRCFSISSLNSIFAPMHYYLWHNLFWRKSIRYFFQTFFFLKQIDVFLNILIFYISILFGLFFPTSKYAIKNALSDYHSIDMTQSRTEPRAHAIINSHKKIYGNHFRSI